MNEKTSKPMPDDAGAEAASWDPAVRGTMGGQSSGGGYVRPESAPDGNAYHNLRDPQGIDGAAEIAAGHRPPDGGDDARPGVGGPAKSWSEARNSALAAAAPETAPHGDGSSTVTVNDSHEVAGS